MTLSSHVTTNLDQWVENGLISAEQREAVAQLIESACDDARDYGYGEGYSDGIVETKSMSYDDAYDDGYSAGYADGQFDSGD